MPGKDLIEELREQLNWSYGLLGLLVHKAGGQIEFTFDEIDSYDVIPELEVLSDDSKRIMIVKERK